MCETHLLMQRHELLELDAEVDGQRRKADRSEGKQTHMVCSMHLLLIANIVATCYY